jgi:hypothetical protein
MSADRLCIDRRFRGPPSSGNGGYVAGLLANALGSSGCVVTLRNPPPLGVELRLERRDAEVQLFADETLIASAASAELDIEVPDPPDLSSAREAESRFAGFHSHVFPGCFVCGPERAAGDGLRIFPGALGNGDSQVAAHWQPDASLAGGDGLVRPEFVWAALDCPGYFAVQRRSGPAVLGRLGVVLHRPIAAGAPVIVTAWHVESDGRKHKAGTALHDASGRLCASGIATWISIASADWQ